MSSVGILLHVCLGALGSLVHLAKGGTGAPFMRAATGLRGLVAGSQGSLVGARNAADDAVIGIMTGVMTYNPFPSLHD